LYEAPGARAGVVLVGGVGGGFDSPAQGLYGRLGLELAGAGAAVLRVRYRDPHVLAAAVADVTTGVRFLGARGASRVGLVGHSLGGAAVIQAALDLPEVVTVVALASQSLGTERCAELSPRSLLLVHGSADAVLSPDCSRRIYEQAEAPKELLVLEGTGHSLDESSADVLSLVRDWLHAELQLGRGLA
jgi:pimeloyl-ACP methyl ester carboxylesterase